MPVDFMTKARGTIPIQQRVSLRSDQAGAPDQWKQFGIFDGLQLAQSGNACTTSDQLYDESKRTWVGAGFSDLELFAVVGEKPSSLREAKDSPLPEALLVKISQHVKEEIPGFPWYSGALRGFLKGVTGKVYDVHKVTERQDGVYFTMYSDPQAIAHVCRPEELAERAGRDLDPLLKQHDIKLRRFNVINADDFPSSVYELMSSFSRSPSAEVTCVTPSHPKLMRERLPEEVRIIWLAPQDKPASLPKNCYHAPPSSIEHQLIKSCGEYLAEARGQDRTPVIGISSIDPLLDANGEKKVKEFLTKLNYKLADFDGFGLLALSHRSLDSKLAAGLERTAEGL
jgi:hypothetical protein